MKIAYVLSTFPCISETFILREIVALEKAGIRVIIFALRSSSPGDSDEATSLMRDAIYRPPPFSSELLKDELFFLRRRPLRYLQLLFQAIWRNILTPIPLLKALRNFPVAAHFARVAERMGADHIHGHFAFVPADIAAVMAALLNKPFSVSAHAWDIYTQPKRRLRRRLANASFVTTCTGRACDYLAGLLPQGRVTAVYHGLALNRFVPSPASAPVLLSVGRLVEKKGFAHLVEACGILAERNRPFSCVIAGDGPQRQLLERMIAERELDDQVSLAGAVSGDALMDLYRKASVFALPSVVAPHGDVDGLPNAILEAMAMEIPVVSTDAAAADEAITDGENGFIVPAGNPEMLADRIETLLKDGTLREKMGSNGRKTVSDLFDVDTNIKQLIKLFSEANDRRP